MTAQVINGKQIAQELRRQLAAQADELRAKGVSLHLVALGVGENAASELYIKNQRKSCEQIGIQYTLRRLGEGAKTAELVREIHKLNKDPGVTGVMVHLPLPGINRRKVQIAIAPEKDVEGINPINLGLVVYGKPNLAPCTAMSVMELIRSTGVPIEGKEAVVVGHSEIVGKPVGLLLLHELATTTVTHIATRDLAFHTRRADILVVAVGKAGLIRADMVKPGSIVIDVGINTIKKKDLQGNPVYDEFGQPVAEFVGDVEYGPVSQVAGHITPVPGGVGPLTVVMLLRNVIDAARIALKSKK